MKKIISIIIFMLITACESIPVLTDYQGEGKGYVLLSQAAKTGTEYGLYMLEVRPLDHAKKGYAALKYFQNNTFYGDDRDFDDTESNGIVRLHQFPPGKYEIYTYQISSQGASKTWVAPEGSYVQFEVFEGKVTYLGEFLAEAQSAPNLFGLTIPWGATISVSDKIERDIKYVSDRLPDANLNKLINQVPKLSSM